MSYLERYLNGEYEQVWAELLALGGAIRQEPLYSDALAVARETMTRARHNIEILIQRLKDLNYQFVEPEWVFVPSDQIMLNRLEMLEHKAGYLALSFRVFCEMVGHVNLIGLHPNLCNRTQVIDGLVFVSDYGLPEGSQVLYSDPLKIILPPEDSIEMYENSMFDDDLDEEFEELATEDEKLEATSPYAHDISGDSIMKAGFSGGLYTICFPDPKIDTLLIGADCTFVEYLRESFQWGGFPGFKDSKNPPTEELAYLTKDLLPI